METNALWALAVLAIVFVLVFSLEIHVQLWQMIRQSILGSLSRFLLFLILGTLATYAAYRTLRSHTSMQTVPQSAGQQSKELTQNGRGIRHKRNHSEKSRRATASTVTSNSEAPVKEPNK
jgi:hypothetical protein